MSTPVDRSVYNRAGLWTARFRGASSPNLSLVAVSVQRVTAAPLLPGMGPDVEVRRSARRRRTVSAYRDGERVVVLIPARFSAAEEREWVDRMVARVLGQQTRRRGGGDAALAR